MAIKTISTVAELITLMGGPNATGQALSATPQAVVNWRTRGQLPTRLHLVHRQILKRHGIRAPSTLWGITDPAEERAA